MKKSDLKNGWIVEFRGGCKNYKYNLHRVVIDDKNNYLVDNEGYFRLSNYKEDLTYKEDCDCEFDIMKVYKPTSIKGFVSFAYKELVWERKNKLKLTIKQLTKIVGEPFEIIEE